MVALTALWLPILVAAILAFFVSFIIHMVLPYHRTDYTSVPDEDATMDALRDLGIQPGDYIMPHAPNPEVMKSEAFQAKVKKGPIAILKVVPDYNMGKSLALWFVYLLAIGILTAYVTGRTVAPGAEYMTVFQISSAVAFIGYGASHAQNAIWNKYSWSSAVKFTFDGLVYALCTAGVFSWLWP